MRHLSIGSIIETHKISSDVAFVELITVKVKDEQGNLVETLRFCRNSENITFGGEVYLAANFNIDIRQEANEEARVKLTSKDPSGIMRGHMENYGGGVGFEVTLVILNTARADADPEIEETFIVIGSSYKGYELSFDLGSENPLRRRFPFAVQYRDRCRHKYKGARCKYSGPLATCDFTRDGPNGCRVHANTQNFGGFSGLISQ